MIIDKAKLKARAEAANIDSDGSPWAYEPHGDTGSYGVGILEDDQGKCVEGRQEAGKMLMLEPVAPEVNGQVFAAFIAATYPKVVLGLLAEIERLEGIKPSPPPRPPEGYGLPRYGLRWNGPSNPLAVLMEDGYWTPWHLVVQLKAEIETLRAQLAERPSQVAISLQVKIKRLEAKLDERDSLVRACFAALLKAGHSEPLRERIKITLSASSEAPATGQATGCNCGACPAGCIAQEASQ